MICDCGYIETLFTDYPNQLAPLLQLLRKEIKQLEKKENEKENEQLKKENELLKTLNFDYKNQLDNYKSIAGQVALLYSGSESINVKFGFISGNNDSNVFLASKSDFFIHFKQTHKKVDERLEFFC